MLTIVYFIQIELRNDGLMIALRFQVNYQLHFNVQTIKLLLNTRLLRCNMWVAIVCKTM